MKVEIGREEGSYTALLITEQGPALLQNFKSMRNLKKYLKAEKKRAEARGKLFEIVYKPVELKLFYGGETTPLRGTPLQKTKEVSNGS